MDKLYNIQGKLIDIGYSIESLSYILESLGEVYELKQEYKTHKNIWIIKILLDLISTNLSTSIDEIDYLILAKREKSESN